jgi:hypothetical protein
MDHGQGYVTPPIVIILSRMERIHTAMGDIASKNNKCHGLYNPASMTETQWMYKSISSLLGCLSTISDGKVTKLTTSLLKHHTLQKSKCIINTNNVIVVEEGFTLSDGKELNAKTNDALAYAIFSQANELSIMAADILNYWCPMIDSLDTAPIVLFVLFYQYSKHSKQYTRYVLVIQCKICIKVWYIYMIL